MSLTKLGAYSLASASLLLLLPSAASGDARYNRKTVEIKVDQTERTKKIEVKKPEEAEKKQPTITADDFIQIEGEVAELRDELIEEYIAAIDDADDDDPRKPELMFRLAEAYSQNQRYFHSMAMETAMKIDAEPNKQKKAALAKKKKQYEDESKKWLLKAVKAYAAIASNPKFREYARIDEVVFYFAYTLQQAGRKAEARKLYKKLVETYQSSKFVPDAYLALADASFEEGNLNDALKDYEKVLKFPRSPIYPYALYKRGWVLFNLGQPNRSFEDWMKVAKLTEGKKREASLNRAAKKDVVRAYAEFGKADKALLTFENIDKGYSLKMLEMLAMYYIEQGKMDKGIYVYQQLMDKDPKNPNICEWEYWVVRAYLTIGTQEQKVKELQNFAKLYKYLVEQKQLKPTAEGECRDNAEGTIRELALVWHQEGIKTLNYTTLGYVHVLYKLYMDYFPDTDDAPQMQFYYAELLWKRAEGEKNPSLQANRWEEAAIEYTRVVEMNKVKKELVKEAAFASVLAWKNALAIDTETETPTTADDDDKKKGDEEELKVPPPEEIPEKQQKMMAAFDVYIKYVNDPQDEELIVIKFLKARIYWRYKHYDEAIPLFEEILKKWPEHEVAEFSANLLLDSLAAAQKYDELVAWVDKLLGMQKFLEDKEDMRGRLETLKRQNMRKKAEKLEADGKFYDCGIAYVEIFNRYPDGDDLDEVLYNAGVCFEKAKSFSNAIQMREELVKRYPKKPTAQKAQYALGQNYAAIAKYREAAEKFEVYAKQFGGERDASAALSNAVFFRKGIGDDQQAIADTEFFVKQYEKKLPAEAAAAHFSMVSIFEKQKKYDDVVKHLNAYLKRFGSKGGVDRQIIAHAKMGEIVWRQSCPVKGVNGACIEVKRARAVKQAKKGKKKIKGTGITQCGPESKIKVTISDRKGNYVKEAQSHFNTVIKLWAKGDAVNKVPGKDETEKAVRAAEMLYWAAAAHFYLAEEKYEKFLKIKFPEGLDFDPEKPGKLKESQKKFKKWMDDKAAALKLAKGSYMAVVDMQPHWGVASAARVGQLYQHFSDAVFTAEIPKDVQKYDYTVEAYCDALGEVTDELEAESVNAYTFCLETATKLNWFNEWSRLCENELSQIRPQDFPTAGEIRAEPDEIPLTLDTQPLAQEIK